MLVLDSSVIVAALVQKEEKHAECRKLLEDVKNGNIQAIAPYTVLVEVVAAIKRRTDSRELAERVARDLQSLHGLYFLELVASRAEKAADIAIKTGLKGMDAIVVELAEEFDAELVTLDIEIKEKSEPFVRIRLL